MPRHIRLNHEKLAKDILEELNDRSPWSETEWAIGDVYGVQVQIRLVKDNETFEPTPRKFVCITEDK